MIGHRYTAQERQFMAEYVPGHSYREIREAFMKKFGWGISTGQVKSYIGNHHLNTGRTGRFRKGQEPPNKGKKGTCAAGCEKTWFKKGHVPANHRPVGSERVNKNGYVEIKVEEPNKWRMKHRVVWESVNGKIPKGCIIIFRDNDKTNTNINNLLLIKRSTNAILNHTGLYVHSGELKETAVHIAELKAASSKVKRRNGKKEEQKCLEK